MNVGDFRCFLRLKEYEFNHKSIHEFVRCLQEDNVPSPEEEARFIYMHATRWLQAWRIAGFPGSVYSAELAIVSMRRYDARKSME